MAEAKLRVCASCEWIFKLQELPMECPKCGFAHYGAYYVYGNQAYQHARTQHPWVERKVRGYRDELQAEADKSNPLKEAVL